MDTDTDDRLHILVRALTARADLDPRLPVAVGDLHVTATIDVRWAWPRPAATLVVDRTTAEQWPQDALAGLVAHQLGYIALGYIRFDVYVLYAARHILPVVAAVIGVWGIIEFAMLPMMLIVGAGLLLAKQAVLWILRHRVYAADRFAVDLIGAAPVRAMLCLQNEGRGARNAIRQHWAPRTHPTIEQRLRARAVRS
ncbi:M48 family metalloprotease [Streptosporangium sp. NBC_01755]|uniref:M48 family metalloprotease n=1 Tax=unclassified Streptosporangium TaxID=2632669 RepID=UPI002DDA1EFA|nr:MULTISPECIES: M48 family metalloprotease [unclassified Streptosporangium]WSA25635.1 M48 family metalloprotease [Streptosporangium sp. NBC_01810]WSD02975.1 M48 family metalloprotease [Streptosporangium sp. NBC_01755]